MRTQSRRGQRSSARTWQRQDRRRVYEDLRAAHLNAVRASLEDHLSDLRKFYSENAQNWGDQNTDRIALNDRIAKLSELLRNM